MIKLYIHESMSIDEAYKFFRDRVSSIKVMPEMDKADMLRINSELDELYNEIFTDYTFWKTRLDIIEAKIQQVERGEANVGSNTESRKARAIKICRKFPAACFDSMDIPRNYDPDNYNGEQIDLYAMRNQCISWFNIFDNIMKIIEFKSSRLMIVANAFKTESNLR